jgi:rubredoxin-NAD+ reductase
LRAAGRLAASAGLAFDSAAGGIVANSQTLATSVEGIYALGDCVVVDGQASRYIEPIARQARGLAAHIQGGSAAPVEAVKAPPVLRVKTSALPITITGALQPGGVWQTERDSAEELRLVRLGPLGQQLGTLVARKSA